MASELSLPAEELVHVTYPVFGDAADQRPDLIDSRYGWLVAVACSWVQIWTSLVYRSSGVILVAAVTTFEITRKEAAWPHVVNLTCNCFTGFFTGFLLRRYDSRLIAGVGCVISSFSLIGCFLWDEPLAHTVFIGFCFGIGSGMTLPTNVVVLSRYFKRNRACANGINSAGASFSSIVFPPVVALLLNKYGLRGTILLLGGLVMNGVAGSIMLKSSPTFPTYSGPATAREPPVRSTALSAKCRPTGHAWRSTAAATRAFVQSMTFLKNAYFYPITLTGMMYNLALTTYLLTIVDHAMGQGLTQAQGSLLLTCMSFTDLLSRLFTGPLTDRHVVSLKQFMVLSFSVMSTCYLLLPFVHTMLQLSAVSVAFGLTSGGNIVVLPVLLVEHLGVEHLPLSFGLHRMAIGVSALARPFLMGYFKDGGGSYDGLFYVTALGCVSIIVMWVAISLRPSLRRLRLVSCATST